MKKMVSQLEYTNSKVRWF